MRMLECLARALRCYTTPHHTNVSRKHTELSPQLDLASEPGFTPQTL